MRRSIGVMTALIAVLVDTGAGLGQPVIQSERQTIPMAVEKRAVGEAGARQALGVVELRSLTPEDPVLVTPGKTHDAKGPVGLTVFVAGPTAPSSIWPRMAIPARGGSTCAR